ncbi:splicing factor, Prp19-binding domain-containing protein [Lactarius sanguifluus]|nr:splicing factor, Prp19-binding domain-containing protein [Lactarius sanguifluus]
MKDHYPEVEGDVAFAGEQDFLRVASDDGGDGEGSEVQKTGKMSLSLKNVNISEEGKVIVSGKEELSRDLSEESEEESGGETASQDGSDQSSLVSESEERVQRSNYGPRSRVTVAEKQSLAEDSEEWPKAFDGSSSRVEKEKDEEHIDVDDTDGLDPLGDFDAWRLRELARIKRDKEAEIAREQEREEIERRRALPEEQRMKEDLARAQRSRDEKPKGGQMFLQKYWHKEILRRHDFTEATESTVDVSLLPTVMQIKTPQLEMAALAALALGAEVQMVRGASIVAIVLNILVRTLGTQEQDQTQHQRVFAMSVSHCGTMTTVKHDKHIAAADDGGSDDDRGRDQRVQELAMTSDVD